MANTKNPPSTLSLANTPVEGRLDVVAYRISERLVNALDNKMGLGGTLWNRVDKMVEEVIKENVSSNPIPDEVRMIIGVIKGCGIGGL